MSKLDYNLRALKLSSFEGFSVLNSPILFFYNIQPDFRALKFSNNKNFRALKFSDYEYFRVLKFYSLTFFSDSNFKVRFSSKSGEF